MSSAHELDGALRVLVSRLRAEGQLITAARSVSAGDEKTLHPIERRQLSGASDARRREFASGRALLRSLIGDDVAIPIGTDRRPVLPSGVRASLAHDRDVVVAALSRSDHIEAVGIDVEAVEQLSAAEAAVIVRPDEGELEPMLAFALKEAAFKAWSNTGGRMLEHHDIRVRLDGGLFRAVVLPSTTLAGAWTRVAGKHAALAVQFSHSS